MSSPVPSPSAPKPKPLPGSRGDSYYVVNGNGVVTRHTTSQKPTSEEPNEDSTKDISIPIEEGSFVCVDAERTTEKATKEIVVERPAFVIDSLMDIARPAKPRGRDVARGYEILPAPPAVIALDDDPPEFGENQQPRIDGEEEWTEVLPPVDVGGRSTKTELS